MPSHSLEPSGSALVPRGTSPPVAVLARGELVRSDARLRPRSALDMVEAEAVRKRNVPGLDAVVDCDGHHRVGALRGQLGDATARDADPFCINRRDPQGTLEILLPR